MSGLGIGGGALMSKREQMAEKLLGGVTAGEMDSEGELGS